MSTLQALDRFLDPIADFLTPDVARQLADFRADSATQARIDELAEKCHEGQLNDEERREYETMVNAIDFVTVLQAKARTTLERSNG